MKKAIIWFLIFVVLASIVAYRLTNTAYDNAYNYDKDYSYGIGNSEDFRGDPPQKKANIESDTSAAVETETEQ